MIRLLAFVLIASISEVLSEKKVIVLSFDGFRPDYVKNDYTPNLIGLKGKATGPSHMVSIFPTKTMATLHTIATGVYPDKHGVYANDMFDENGGVKLYDQNHFDDLNKDIVPIWIENQKKGRGTSGLMMWPGGEFLYNGEVAKYTQSYDESMTWDERVKMIDTWISTNHCNLVMANFEDYPYYKKSDIDAHIKEHANKIDKVIHSICQNYSNDYDIVILSDHGTSKVPGTQVLELETYFDKQGIPKIVSGPLVFLKVANAETRNTIFSELDTRKNNFNVYKRSTFQHDWYIRELESLDDVILLVAEPKYTFMERKVFSDLLTAQGLTPQTFMTLENGYDNDEEDMYAFFLGIGPGFKDNIYPGNTIQLIDVYPLLKALLVLKGAITTVQNTIAVSGEMQKFLEPQVLSTYKSA